MADLNSVRIYLYIEGYTCASDEISEALGISPDKVSVKGQITPGHKVPARFNFLEVHSTMAETEDLDKQINSIIDKINDIEQFKAEVDDRKLNIGINTVIRLNGEASPVCAMSLTSKTLTKLSQLGCEMDFDIYG